MHIKSLHIYPLKSARGIDVTQSDVTLRGLKYDRTMMLVDPSGQFMTQRECPKLATVNVQVDDHGAAFDAPGYAQMGVAWDQFSHDADTPVQVWKSALSVSSAPHDADRWFSDVLGIPARLVYQRDNHIRLAKQERAPGGIVSFADGYPFLFAWQSSLDDLNLKIKNRGGVSIGMDRFRPNIVIDGGDPWVEDTIGSLNINDIVFQFVRPCTRCVITTTDQLSGMKPGKEPLATLAKFRFDKEWEGVVFGENAYTKTSGIIRINDPVMVTGQKSNLNFERSKLG